MHQQIKASPDDTAENVRTIVDALAAAEINIEAIAPDFDPPHVRVLVKHNPDYDPDDVDDPFNRALEALRGVGLEPEIRRSVEPVQMPNVPKALKTAMDTLESEQHVIESVLVLPGAQGNKAQVSFGVLGEVDDEWEAEAERLQGLIDQAIRNLT
jgi:hypothetical protein